MFGTIEIVDQEGINLIKQDLKSEKLRLRVMAKQVKFSRMLKIIRNLSRLENPRLNKLLRKCVISKVITASQRSCGKVMCSFMCGCQSVCPWAPMMHWTSL